jgi:hypothetical protein
VVAFVPIDGAFERAGGEVGVMGAWNDRLIGMRRNTSVSLKLMPAVLATSLHFLVSAAMVGEIPAILGRLGADLASSPEPLAM